VHHEEAAAFMATAHAKATGKIGVCLATSGPGGIHLLNGLYDAKLDHMPVLAITGMQETSILGPGYQQEVALDKLYQDVAEYDQMIYNPVQLPAIVDIAIRTAYARRGVAHITVPIGIQHAYPGRQVIAFVGDGGFAMLMAEFLTAIQHQLPVKIVVNNNNALGQILWEQMILGARPPLPGARARAAAGLC